MQNYDSNHEIYAAVVSFIQASRCDERLMEGPQKAQHGLSRKKVIREIATEVADAHKVDVTELINLTGSMLDERS